MIVVLPLFAAACAPKATTEMGSTTLAASDLRSGPAVVGTEAGLEVAWFVTSADEHALGAVLGKYAENLVPMSSEQQALWRAHGLRMVSVPIDEADAVTGALRTSGQSQRQWLGQAYTWTEVVRGPEMALDRTVALDAERIRLGPGALRLLVRDWVEPVPGADGSAPTAALRVEIVPQHEEDRLRAQRADPLGLAPPRIAAEEQGLLFSRLYARLSVTAGNAYLIIPERPGVEWQEPTEPEPTDENIVANESEKPTPERAAPRVGEVVRGEPRSTTPVLANQNASGGTSERAGASGGIGPVAPYVQTVGEAMLMRPPQPGKADARPARAVVVLVPRVPKEFRLIERTARPQPAAGTPARP